MEIWLKLALIGICAAFIFNLFIDMWYYEKLYKMAKHIAMVIERLRDDLNRREGG